VKINSITLHSEDLEGTAAFYGKLMNSAPRVSQGTVTVFAGSSEIRFIKSAVTMPVYHFAFNIPRNRINEALTYISGITELVKVENGAYVADFSAWNAEAVYFFDNNGNILECIARHDLENGSDKPFSGRSLLSVSEIALVTGNVKSLADELLVKTGIGVYEKQPMLENFAALGDAEGLFILSAENRNWYPTDIKARRFPLAVEAESGGRVYKLAF
jgi:hypothetical protein